MTLAKKIGRSKERPSGLKAGFTREEKTDFTDLYLAHRYEMFANGCDVDSMIKLRHTMH